MSKIMLLTSRLSLQRLERVSSSMIKTLSPAHLHFMQSSVARTKLCHQQFIFLKSCYSTFYHKHVIQSKDLLKDVDLANFKETSPISKQRRSLIANALQCDDKTLDNIVHRYPRFLSVSPGLVKEKLETYHSYDLPLEILHENPRCLLETSNKDLKERLQKLKESGLLTDLLGPQNVAFQSCFGFYLECTKEVFEKSFKYLCYNLAALEGCANLPEYLQSRLECSDNDTQKICNMHVVKRGISLARIKEVLDFALIDAGLSKKDTIKTLNLLLNISTKKLHSRLSFYKENLEHDDRNKPSTLIYLLRLSERKFNATYMDQFKVI